MRFLSLTLLSFALCLGCGDDDRPADASTDTTVRDGAPADSAVDARVDAALDAAADATADATVDATPDAPIDATSDADPADANDAAVDAVSDARVDSSADGVGCDKRMIRCRVPEPDCPPGQVPQITEDGSCYTLGCVPIEMCRCTVAEECSDPLMYVCRRDTGRCTPPL